MKSHNPMSSPTPIEDPGIEQKLDSRFRGNDRILGLKIINYTLVITLFLGVIFLQYGYDLAHTDTIQDKVERNLLIEPKVFSASFLKMANLGLNQATADMIWLETIQYFGGGDFNKKYYALPKLLQTITDLDPKFTEPYLFGILILPFQGDSKSALELGEKGIKNNPKFGMASYYLASIYHQQKNYKRASELYLLASKDPNTPKAAKILAGVSLSQLDEKQAAYVFWQGILEKSKKDSFEYKRSKVWLEHLQNEIILEQIVLQYKKKFGKFPNNLEQLVETGLIEAIPVSPIKAKYIVDSKTGKVSYEK